MFRLTDVAIRLAQPREHAYKLRDGGGLFLLVTPVGSRYWRFRYRYDGRERCISLGLYPGVSLKAARLRCAEARGMLADGTDPAAKRRAEQLARANTFETVAEEWLSRRQHVAAATLAHDRHRLRAFIYPSLGKRPIASIEPPELLAPLRRIEARGRHATAHRTKSVCGRIFRYAIATGRADRDASADLREALIPPVRRRLPAVTDPREVGELLRAIDTFDGHIFTAIALRLLPLLFTRPGELRGARWSEINWQENYWRIPPTRMKRRREHIVPLSRQALSVLRELYSLTGDGQLLFPSLSGQGDRPMSSNALSTALRRLGYSREEMTCHGFRTLASTLLNEQGYAPDVVELQLAHVDGNQVRAIYNRALRLAERRAMMQGWADYLDRLRRESTCATAQALSPGCD